MWKPQNFHVILQTQGSVPEEESAVQSMKTFASLWLFSAVSQGHDLNSVGWPLYQVIDGYYRLILHSARL